MNTHYLSGKEENAGDFGKFFAFGLKDKDKMNISYLSGKEEHTSNWGKFFVFGLKDFAVATDDKRNRGNNHYSFQYYEAIVPDGKIFNVHLSEGNKYGPSDKAIYICKVVADSAERIEQKYTGCFLAGSFVVIAKVEGSILKVDRFTAWWQAKPEAVDPEVWALHCAKYIDVRGMKNLPALATKEIES